MFSYDSSKNRASKEGIYTVSLFLRASFGGGFGGILLAVRCGNFAPASSLFGGVFVCVLRREGRGCDEALWGEGVRGWGRGRGGTTKGVCVTKVSGFRVVSK